MVLLARTGLLPSQQPSYLAQTVQPGLCIFVCRQEARLSSRPSGDCPCLGGPTKQSPPSNMVPKARRRQTAECATLRQPQHGHPIVLRDAHEDHPHHPVSRPRIEPPRRCLGVGRGGVAPADPFSWAPARQCFGLRGPGIEASTLVRSRSNEQMHGGSHVGLSILRATRP